jgi:hypothetical protein
MTSTITPSGPSRVRVDNVALALPADLVEDAASTFGDLRRTAQSGPDLEWRSPRPLRRQVG